MSSKSIPIPLMVLEIGSINLILNQNKKYRIEGIFSLKIWHWRDFLADISKKRSKWSRFTCPNNYTIVLLNLILCVKRNKQGSLLETILNRAWPIANGQPLYRPGPVSSQIHERPSLSGSCMAYKCHLLHDQ
jgi:hypothetical protein